MKRYSIFSNGDKWEGAIKFAYFDNDVISSIEFPKEISDDTIAYFSGNVPITYDLFTALVVMQKGRIRVVDESDKVKMDLSFTNFWQTYGKPRGSKDEIESLWWGDKKTRSGIRINEQDQRDILTILPMYVLEFKGEQKKYQPLPHTFLFNRLWIAEMERLTPKPKTQLTEKFLEKRNLPPLPPKGISLQEYLEAKPTEEIGIIQKLIKG